MTTTTAASARPARAARKPKPEGQWKIDGTEPLNHTEVVKREEAAFEVKQRIIDIYSKQGFSSIAPDDIAPRFKWLGIYTQRKQDLGGELTGQVPDSELQDEYFMMRVRFDGGHASPERLRVVGELSRDYARSTADFTDRQNIQLHWVRIEDVPTIWEKLETVGLSTALGCGDVPRVILGSPVAGVAAEELIDATPAFPSCLLFTQNLAQDLSALLVAVCPPTQCWLNHWALGFLLMRFQKSGPVLQESSAITVSDACVTVHV